MKAGTHTDLYTHVQSSVMHSSQVDITQVPVIRRTDKQNVVEAHDGIFLSPKGEAVVSHAASWTNLEDTMLSEISQS